LRANADEYAARKAAVAATQAVEPAAGIILLAACEDRQTAHDGELHGLFTAALLATWNGGAFAGGHDAFLAAIQTRVGAAQTPTLFSVGAVEPAFLAARPFTP
jgi:predicted neuraminidase